MAENNFEDIAKSAKNASIELASLKCETKNSALLAVAEKLDKDSDKIFEANKSP